MIKAFKYRLNPTKAQSAAMDTTLYLCRQLYNAALEERKAAYKKCGVSLGYYQQKRSLTEIREALPEYKRIHSQVLQGVVERLDKAFKGFFARIKRGDKPGFPRFQGRNRFDSFTYPQAGKTGAFAHVASGKVTLSGIGNVRCTFHRALEGNLKTATVKREADGWYVVFVCEVEIKPLPATGNSIGIDLGLTDIVATSDGELIAAPKNFSKAQKALAKAQRRLARRKKGSKNREEARIQVAKLHQKVARQRADFLHKLSYKLVKENDLIVHEELTIAGLAKGMLAKSVHDVSWGKLIEMLTYKAENAGRQLIAIDPKYTSQDCSSCGHREKHPLWVREFECACCGTRHHRDLNAASNIKARALPLGVNVSLGKLSIVQEAPLF